LGRYEYLISHFAEASAVLSGEMPLPDVQDAGLRGKFDTDDASGTYRQALLTALLNWCRSSGLLGLPPLSWFSEEEEDAEEQSPTDERKKKVVLKSSRKSCRIILNEQKRATSKVGFLILPYRVRRFALRN